MIDSTSIGFLVLALLILAVYMLPTIVAFSRGRHNKVAILVLNVFLGWTLLGWVISLVWAVSSTKPTVVVVENK